MNILDIVVCLILLLAVWNGWRHGFILQICSLVGLVVGIWVAYKFGAAVGGWLHFDRSIAFAGGFVVVLLSVVLVLAIVGRLLRGLFKFAGFGLFDSLLGVVVSVFEYLLLLSVLFSALDRLNADYTIIGAQKIEHSKTYEPIKHLSDKLVPFLERLKEQ